MFRFGIHRSIVETTPVQLLYRPGGKEKPRARVFSGEELKAFLTNLDDAYRFQRLQFSLPTPRHATSTVCNSGAASPAGEPWRCGSNTPLAQRELRARGRNWFEGRIAECPRLQQKRLLS